MIIENDGYQMHILSTQCLITTPDRVEEVKQRLDILQWECEQRAQFNLAMAEIRRKRKIKEKWDNYITNFWIVVSFAFLAGLLIWETCK